MTSSPNAVTSGDGEPIMPGEGRSIGLRGRLAAFFVVISVVPVAVAVVALQLQIDSHLTARSEAELATVRRAAVALVEGQRARAGDLANDVADRLVADELAHSLPEDEDDLFQEWLQDEAADAISARADFVALARADGTTVGVLSREPRFSDPQVLGPVEEVIAQAIRDETPPGVIVELREIRVLDEGLQETAGWVVAGLWTDASLLDRLAVSGGIALVAEGAVLAVSDAASATDVHVAELPEPGELASVEISGQSALITVEPFGPAATDRPPALLALWIPGADQLPSPLIGFAILVPSVLAAGLLGWLLASSVVHPVSRAASVARRVAGGDLSRTLPAGGGPELNDLAASFNSMSEELAKRLRDLEESRDRLRGSLSRLGELLSSSLDLNRTLAVIVETAMETLDGDRALLMLFTPERDALYAKVGRGVGTDVPVLEVGEGLVGYVAQTAAPLRLPGGEDGEPLPVPAEDEPTGAGQLLVPMLGRGRVLGVLSVMRDDGDDPFTHSDLETIRSFAAQASVAVENVMLHQEAQRLSVTDPLTGLWNFRYFQIQAERELEGAARFERPLSLIVADLDHFKEVNDQHGHQVGDEVLREVARRLRASTRIPDVVARYGGEEFIVLLPGTDLRGAVEAGERIRANVAEAPVTVSAAGVTATTDPVPVHPLQVTCSVGVATLPAHGRTVAALLRNADAAMYAAKHRGRNQVVAANDSLEPA